MKKSRVLVHDYVNAGYQKIHIDTSMRCSDDPRDQPLKPQIIAERTADLIAVSESAFSQLGHQTNYIRYIIGTEVPPPGGMQGCEETALPTKPELVQETIELTRLALDQHGLASVWERVIAIVVQPGVEYGDQKIINYKPEAAKGLKSFIENINGMIYEAHSTDYQTRSALQRLIEDHYAILKVGPALTFAYREAIYALALIEEELSANHRDWQPSNIINTLEEVMLDNPEYWREYYLGTDQVKKSSRHYSFSDRIRYYWPEKRVQISLNRLLNNLQSIEIPLSLLSQYLPNQFHSIRSGNLANEFGSIIQDKITQVLEDYNFACRGSAFSN
jgi:D-tagatose-1,6-bisphosphate aldolase subunit GatZ/KbaZ